MSYLEKIRKRLKIYTKSEFDSVSREKSDCQKKKNALEERIETLNAAKARYEEKRKEELEALKTTLKQKGEKINAMIKEREWCAPDILPPPTFPKGISKNTLQSATELLKNKSGSIFDLCFRERLIGSSNWALYWLIAHASRSAISASGRYLNEDGISRAFLNELGRNVELAEEFLEVAYSPIFEQVRPALKEEDVGADILLVVSGSGLCPRGGLKIFWIQAKRNDESSPYILDFWREKNKHGFQFDTLRKQHQPNKGSASFYMMYSPRLEFLPAISVGDMPEKAPETKMESKKDLSDEGERLAEFLTARIQNEVEMGEFKTSEELIAFLEAIPHPAPVNIVVVHSNESEYKPSLLSKLSNHYEAFFKPKPDEKSMPSPKM